MFELSSSSTDFDECGMNLVPLDATPSRWYLLSHDQQ
jgi:hypothetical protein